MIWESVGSDGHMVVKIRQLKLLLPTGVCPAPPMDIIALRQRCLTCLGIATIYSLACSSLPAAWLLGLFLCASLTVSGCATFAALPPSAWAPRTSPCLSVGCRRWSHKLCLHCSCGHADHPDWWEMEAHLAPIQACAPFPSVQSPGSEGVDLPSPGLQPSYGSRPRILSLENRLCFFVMRVPYR